MPFLLKTQQARTKQSPSLWGQLSLFCNILFYPTHDRKSCTFFSASAQSHVLYLMRKVKEYGMEGKDWLYVGLKWTQDTKLAESAGDT